MAANVPGNAISCKLQQPAKAPSPMAANVAGNAISRKLLHLAKAPSPMTANVSGNAISCKLQHPEKAPSPYLPPHSIEVTPSGSTTLVRVASPANAPLRSMPCFFTLSAA